MDARHDHVAAPHGADLAADGALPLDGRTRDEEVLSDRSPQADAARIERMQAELRMGFRALAGLGPAVSVFGSARTPRDHPEYHLAVEVAQTLAAGGYAVITGGGPGTMEAANRGAALAGRPSVGLGIELPYEQDLNEFCTLPLMFHYFFIRKVMFVRAASAFVVLPGGFGTLDEVFEALTLIQTGKIRHFPVVFVGSDYWGGLLGWIEQKMLQTGKVSPQDMNCFQVTDSPAECLQILNSARSAR